MFSSLRWATPWDSSPTSLTNYDVSADGQRFLMVKRESAVAHLSVVLNWFSELTRLAPGTSR